MATTSLIIRKFFTHKIQSTELDWQDFLLNVADVCSRFDGQPYDREAITHEFELLSDRDPYVIRDPSFFRDKFSAYASSLGVYYVTREKDLWVTRLTRAARDLLCCTEPDPGAFCTVQLALFQYPAGYGVTHHKDGHPRKLQANVRDDIVAHVAAGIRLVPLRVIAKLFLAYAESGSDLRSTELTFGSLLNLFNLPSINGNPSATNAAVYDAYQHASSAPSFATEVVGRFKRNFHILEQTGLFKRTKDKTALCLDLGTTQDQFDSVLRKCKAIASLTSFYDEFHQCADAPDPGKCVNEIALNLGWGAYFDGGNLPSAVLSELAPGTVLTHPDPLATVVSNGPYPAFPDLEPYGPSRSRPRPAPLTGSESPSDPEQARILKEKANRSHARIVALLAATARGQGAEPKDNIYVDLCIPEYPAIVEVKSCNQTNMLDQVRKGVSQLYEYRFRSGLENAALCLALEEEPLGRNAWLIRYLLDDRGIYPIWVAGDITLDGLPETKGAFPVFFP